MLTTVFSFRGLDYKGNLIPESYNHLRDAATKIKSIDQSRQLEESSKVGQDTL